MRSAYPDLLHSQAYETRADLARQRSSLTGINARMTNVLSEYYLRYPRSRSRLPCSRHYAWHKQLGLYDQIKTETRFHHPRSRHWDMYNLHSFVFVVTQGLSEYAYLLHTLYLTRTDFVSQLAIHSHI